MTTEAIQEPARRLQRPRDGRMLGGVALGLARYFDVDPVIFRIVFAVLAVFGGSGLLLYGAGWLLMPEEGAPTSHLEAWIERRRASGRRGWLLITIAVVLIIAGVSAVSHAHFGGVVGGVVLIGLAVLLAREHRRSRTAVVATTTTTTTTTTAPVVAVEPRFPLASLTLGATLLTLGALTAVGISGAVSLRPADVIAVALGIVGAGLLASAFVGRAWSLIPVGLLLTIALAVAHTLPSNVSWTAGDRTWTPAASDGRTHYNLGVGRATLDLTNAAANSYSVTVGAGRIVVIVPPDADVDVKAHAGAGDLKLLGVDRNGTGVDAHRVFVGSGEHLTLNLRVGFGEVEVDRAAA